MAIFGVLIALEYPEYFHLISVIIGLMATYVVIMIDYFLKIGIYLVKKRGE